MPENPNKAPTIDPKAWQRNKTTAWLEFLDRLSSWLWQDNEGAARWTLVLDDAERHSSTTHPTRTAPGLKAQRQCGALRNQSTSCHWSQNRSRRR